MNLHSNDQPEGAIAADLLAEQLLEVGQLLGEMKHDMKEMQYRVRLDEPEAVRDNLRLLSDLRNWLKIAFELETKFHDRDRERQGRADQIALDFDAARDQIRCRLDRLRQCGAPERFSGRLEP